MIRLIATDLDGTLVKEGTSQLDPEYFEVIRALREKGVLFAASSGRNYASIAKVFEPVKNEMAFLAENGGHAVVLGEEKFKITLESEDVKAGIAYGRRQPDNFVMLSTIGGALTDCRDAAKVREIGEGYSIAFRQVEDLMEHTADEVLKIAMFCGTLDSRISQALAAEALADHEKMTPMVTGTHWVDYVPAGVDKGFGLMHLAEMMGIRREETMAFGDNLNDVPMIKAAGVGICVDNGREDVKKAADRIIPGYRENGVLNEMKAVLKEVSE